MTANCRASRRTLQPCLARLRRYRTREPNEHVVESRELQVHTARLLQLTYASTDGAATATPEHAGCDPNSCICNLFYLHMQILSHIGEVREEPLAATLIGTATLAVSFAATAAHAQAARTAPRTCQRIIWSSS